MADENEQPVTETTDDYADAFAQASGEPVAPTQEETTEPKVDEPAVEASTEETKPVETPAPEATKPVETPAADKPVETPVAEAPKPAETPQVPADLDPKYLAQAIAEEQARLAKANQPAPTPEAAKTYAAEDFLDDNAKAAINKFKTEWPDEFPAIQQMYRAEVQAQVINARNTLVAELNTVLAPIIQSMGKVEVNSHLGSIRSAHTDFDAVLPAVKEWVTTQPAFMRGPMQAVLEAGTAQDVIDLVAAYKVASVPSGAAPATPAPTAAQETRPAVVAKAPVNPAAVAALAAVPTTQRAKPAGNADPLDFTAAFEEAAQALA